MPSAESVRVAILGAGAVADYHHAPGLRLDPRARLCAACDVDPALLARRKDEWGLDYTTSDPRRILEDRAIDAVVICTPNHTHAPLTLAALEAGKHVMCEKPLGLNAGQVRGMLAAARAARRVHMTAFTYRFAPAMRYLNHMLRRGELGTPRHFRSQRFVDLPETSWGWRQAKALAGAGNLFDYTIHRIDFALDLMGPLRRLTGAVARFAPRDRTADGVPCPPSEVDDWSCILGEFRSGAVGVWEGTLLAKGYKKGGFGHEWAEVNGSEGSAVYQMHEPNTILLGRPGQDLDRQPVPVEWLRPSGSPRDPGVGEPATVFRYDLVWEFVSAIVENREAVPSFDDGLAAQVVADAVLQSHSSGRWIDLQTESA
jgi:predicted dehydrogenase